MYREFLLFLGAWSFGWIFMYLYSKTPLATHFELLLRYFILWLVMVETP